MRRTVLTRYVRRCGQENFRELATILAKPGAPDTAAIFLGLGAQPPDPSWGQMLQAARQFLEPAPWTGIAPGAAITLVVLGFNLLGDGLRDILDPRLR